MKHALKALVVLAEERAGAQRSLTIEEIAKASDTPKRFPEHILLDIRNRAADRGLTRNPRPRPGPRCGRARFST